MRVRDFKISYGLIRWPAFSINQNNGGLRGEKFRVRVVICVVYLPCLTCRRCQKTEKRLGCLWQKITAKYLRIKRGNQIVLVCNSVKLRKLQNSKGSLNTHKQTGQTFYRVSFDSNLRVYLSRDSLLLCWAFSFEMC